MRAKIASSKKRHQEHYDKLDEKIQLLMAIDNEVGLAVKVALLSGLRREEMVYAFCEEVCDNPNCCIGCKKLHVINKRNGLSIIVLNWVQSDRQRCYFTMLPTMLWQHFRSLPAFNESDIKATDEVVSKAVRIKFSGIRGIFNQVVPATMNSRQVDILTGVASPSTAKQCLMLEVDEMAKSYVLAWENAGVILPVL
jgi:hypothetical protein